MTSAASVPAVCAREKVPVNKYGLNWEVRFSCVKSGERNAVGFPAKVLDLTEPFFEKKGLQRVMDRYSSQSKLKRTTQSQRDYI